MLFNDYLIIRQGGLGDLIMLTSAVNAFINRYPGSRITLATFQQYIDLFKDLKIFFRVLSIKKAMEGIALGILNFKRIFNLIGSVESPVVGGRLKHEIYMTENRIDIFEKLLGIDPPYHKKTVMVDLKAKWIEQAKEKINYDPNFKYIAVQISCATPIRTYPPEEMVKIGKLFDDRKFKIIWLGGIEDWFKAYRHLFFDFGINLIGKTDLSELIAICYLSDLIIAPDSSAVHISATFNKPCIALFGNINPYLRVAYYPKVKALFPSQVDCPNFPCGDNVMSKCYLKPQKQIGGDCIRSLNAEEIYNEAMKLL